MQMSLTKRAMGHFKTITYHKWLVMKGCFAVGLYRQGLIHDLSKYSPTEFLSGVYYYQGNRSPNAAEREKKGYSGAWLHHKGRNKHHYEYWCDVGKDKYMAGVKMPLNFVIEMFMDRIAASKVYEKENYTNASVLNYYNLTKDYILIHEDTRQLLVRLLKMLEKKGERYTFAYIKKVLLPRKTY